MGLKIQQLKNNTQHKQSTKKQKAQGGLYSLLNKDIKLFGNQMPLQQKCNFYNELAILLNSGLDISSTLSIIEQNTTKKKDKETVHAIRENIINGNPLSDAIQKTGRFSDYEYYSLRIGEESGYLNKILSELQNFFNKRLKQRRQLINSLSYPVLIVITAFGAIFFMLNYMVPMFDDVYKRLGGDLPGITKFIISLSDMIGAVAGPAFLIILILIGIYQYFKKKDIVKKINAALITKLPVFGKTIQNIYFERFCHSMSLLLSSNVPLVNSLNLVKHMISYYPLKTAIESIEKNILSGKHLHECMMQNKLFPIRFSTMVKVGEEVNKLDTIFHDLHLQLNDEIEHRLSMVSSMLEPILIIFIGFFVAIILISMYLPIFQISNTF